MCRVPIFTDKFNQLRVRHDALIDFNRPRFRVCLWIVDRDLDFETSIVGAPKTLGHFSGIGHRTAANIEPLPVVESCSLDHESVPFPMSDGVAVVPGLHIIFIRLLAAIREYLAQPVVCLIKNDQQSRGLDHLARFRMIVKLHESHWQTMRIGIVFAVVGIPFFHQVGGPGLERQIIFEASPCIAERRDWNPIRRKWGYRWSTCTGAALPGAALPGAALPGAALPGAALPAAASGNTATPDAGQVG